MRRLLRAGISAVVGLLAVAGASSALGQSRTTQATPDSQTPTPVVVVGGDTTPVAPTNDPWGSTFKNHLAIQLGFGYGTLPMGSSSSEGKYVTAYNQTLSGLGFALSGSEADPGGELHVALTLTYYFPYYITLRAGGEVAFFEPTENINPTSGGGQTNVITNYGGTVMIPVLLGPHLSFADDKVVVELMVGPTFTVYTSNGLSGPSSLTNNVQMNANTAIGVDGLLGIHYMASKIFGVGIEGGYRSLVTGPVHQISAVGAYDFNGVTPISLDFTGFRGVVDMMILAM